MTNPSELFVDGDLLALIEKILAEQGPDSAQISKVKGHADESMVRDGRVRMLDKIGNDLADPAADFGRRRVPPAISDSMRMVHSACTAWYSLIPDLHRLFIAIAGKAVNRDGRGGILFTLRCGLLPVSPSVGGFFKPYGNLLGPQAILGFGVLVQLACYRDLGVGGVSYIEPLILYEKMGL